jgi:hypothetical protein
MSRFPIALLVCLVTEPLQGMTWSDLEAEIRSVAAGNPGNITLIQRFSDSVQLVVTYNQTQQLQFPGTQLFCPAPDTPVTLDEMVSLVRAEDRHQ